MFDQKNIQFHSTASYLYTAHLHIKWQKRMKQIYNQSNQGLSFFFLGKKNQGQIITNIIHVRLYFLKVGTLSALELPEGLSFHLFIEFWPLVWSAADITRNLFVISVNDGRAAGSGDQHCSISFRHSGSQQSGTGGRRVLFIIPPSSFGTNCISMCQWKHEQSDPPRTVH